MKATLTALELAKASRDCLRRINGALEEATKRLSQLTQEHPVTPRIATAIEQIQTAMKTADTTKKVASRIAFAALCTGPEAVFELGDIELATLSYGIEPAQIT